MSVQVVKPLEIMVAPEFTAFLNEEKPRKTKRKKDKKKIKNKEKQKNKETKKNKKTSPQAERHKSSLI